MGDTLRSRTISTNNQEIASQDAMKSKENSEERLNEIPPILVAESSLTSIREMAKADLGMTFTTLTHRIDLFLLGKSFRQLGKNTATGVDKVTADEYAANLDVNLYKLYLRLKRGQYAALPVKRIWIDKEDGKQRKRCINRTFLSLTGCCIVGFQQMFIHVLWHQGFKFIFRHGFR